MNTTNENPIYTDVCNLSDDYERWRRTYEYRGIKYDIALLHGNHSTWYVVESPDEGYEVTRLIRKSGLRDEFLYHVCDEYKSGNAMFYCAVDHAMADIDWFLDDSLEDLTKCISELEHTRSEFRAAIDNIVNDKETSK